MSRVQPLVYLFIISSLTFSSCSVFRNKKYSNAEQVLPENKRQEFDRYFFDANKEKLIGNADDAVKYFKKCITIWPSSGAANYELALLSIKKKDFSAATNYAKVAYQTDVSNGFYATLYAEMLKINRQFDKASKIYENIIKLYPDRTDWYLNWANLLLMKPNYNKALSVLDRLEKQTGVNEDIVQNKVQIYLKLNKFDKAKAEIEKLILLNPSDAKNYTRLGSLYKANGKEEEALQNYKKALELDPTDVSVHFELADFYRDKGEKQKYFDELHLLFTNDDIDIDTKVNWLITFYNVSVNDTLSQKNILKLTDEVCATHPLEAKSFALKGDFLFRDKKYKEAREAYLKAIELDKSKYLIWNQLLVIDSELNDWEAMSRDADKTNELFPNEPAPYLLNGMAKMQLKNNKEAIAILNKGIDYVVDNKALKGQFCANLGDAYNQEKNNIKSDSCYEKALELNPNDVYVLNNYSYYLSVRNEKLEKAEEMSKKSNELEPNNSSYLDTYAWILYAQKKFTEAKFYMEKALEKDSNKSPVLLEHYGDILYQLGNKDIAYDYWQKAKAAGKGSDFLEKKITEKRLIE